MDCTPQQDRDTPSLPPEMGVTHDLLSLSLKQILIQLQQSSPSSANKFNSTERNKSSSEFQTTQFPTSVSTQSPLLSPNDAGLVPNCAPLFSLFNRSAVSPDQNDYAKSGAPGKNDLQILQAAKLYMLSMNDLSAIFIQGHHYWKVWLQTFPEQLITKLNGTRDEQAMTLCTLIYTSLHSADRAFFAKIVLCTLLHIQQLPQGSSCADPVLQQNCLDSAESLLASDEGLAGTLDGLECMLLQAEYYINLASLRKVWLIVRRAINLAQLLELHQVLDDVNVQLIQRRKGLWMQLWQMDRGFSMILGLPCATLDTQYPAVSLEMHEECFLRNLGVVMGRIIARNQNHNQMTYTVTLEIDEELEECKGLMLPSWWEPQKRNSTSSDRVFLDYSKKMKFYTARKLVHLPFMLKAYTDHRYAGSRIAALEASKAIIGAFQALRDERLLASKMCEMADFEAFCAAMTIVVDLVSRRPRDDEESDWQMILDVAKDLDRVSYAVSCSVAAKGAQVLKDLYDSRSHSISSNSSLKLDIPYFGKICILQAPPDPNASPRMSLGEIPSQSLQATGEVPGVASNAVPSFDGWFFPYTGDPQLGQNGYGSAMTTTESSFGEDWNWFLGIGDSI